MIGVSILFLRAYVDEVLKFSPQSNLMLVYSTTTIVEQRLLAIGRMQSGYHHE